MGEYKNKAYPLRIDGTVMEKLKIMQNEIAEPKIRK